MIYRGGAVLALTSILLPISGNAATPQPWLLNPTEYGVASALSLEKNDPCEVAIALNVTTSLDCKGDVKRYGLQIQKEFRLAHDAVVNSGFTRRDYEVVWASNYPADHSEPGYTFAACAVSFQETYIGEPSDSNILSPSNLVCNRSMIIYGKQMIELFETATKAEMRLP